MTAGLVRHHKSLAALMCPTVNSFKRLRPSNICGYVGNWGYDHRCATTRIPLERGKGNQGGTSTGRLCSQSICGSRSGIAGLPVGLRSGKLSIVPDPEPSENFSAAPIRDNVVADTLGNALTLIYATDKALCDAVGIKLIDHFLALKTKEWNDYLDHTTDWELDTYLQFI